MLTNLAACVICCKFSLPATCSEFNAAVVGIFLQNLVQIRNVPIISISTKKNKTATKLQISHALVRKIKKRENKQSNESNILNNNEQKKNDMTFEAPTSSHQSVVLL